MATSKVELCLILAGYLIEEIMHHFHHCVSDARCISFNILRAAYDSHASCSMSRQSSDGHNVCVCALCRAVLLQLAEDENWPVGWVFDGRKNIYVSACFTCSFCFDISLHCTSCITVCTFHMTFSRPLLTFEL